VWSTWSGTLKDFGPAAAHDQDDLVSDQAALRRGGAGGKDDPAPCGIVLRHEPAGWRGRPRAPRHRAPARQQRHEEDGSLEVATGQTGRARASAPGRPARHTALGARGLRPPGGRRGISSPVTRGLRPPGHQAGTVEVGVSAGQKVAGRALVSARTGRVAGRHVARRSADCKGGTARASRPGTGHRSGQRGHEDGDGASGARASARALLCTTTGRRDRRTGSLQQPRPTRFGVWRTARCRTVRRRRERPPTWSRMRASARVRVRRGGRDSAAGGKPRVPAEAAFRRGRGGRSRWTTHRRLEPQTVTVAADSGPSQRSDLVVEVLGSTGFVNDPGSRSGGPGRRASHANRAECCERYPGNTRHFGARWNRGLFEADVRVRRPALHRRLRSQAETTDASHDRCNARAHRRLRSPAGSVAEALRVGHDIDASFATARRQEHIRMRQRVSARLA
jgi:hypothetical protein